MDVALSFRRLSRMTFGNESRLEIHGSMERIRPREVFEVSKLVSPVRQWLSWKARCLLSVWTRDVRYWCSIVRFLHDWQLARVKASIGYSARVETHLSLQQPVTSCILTYLLQPSTNYGKQPSSSICRLTLYICRPLLTAEAYAHWFRDRDLSRFRASIQVCHSNPERNRGSWIRTGGYARSGEQIHVRERPDQRSLFAPVWKMNIAPGRPPRNKPQSACFHALPRLCMYQNG